MLHCDEEWVGVGREEPRTEEDKDQILKWWELEGILQYCMRVSRNGFYKAGLKMSMNFRGQMQNRNLKSVSRHILV